MVCPSVAGTLWREALNHQCGYPRVFLHGLHMLYPYLPRLAASVILITTLLIALAHSLQLLVYVYYTVYVYVHVHVVTMPHLLEASTSYHILSHKAIS